MKNNHFFLTLKGNKSAIETCLSRLSPEQKFTAIAWLASELSKDNKPITLLKPDPQKKQGDYLEIPPEMYSNWVCRTLENALLPKTGKHIPAIAKILKREKSKKALPEHSLKGRNPLWNTLDLDIIKNGDLRVSLNNCHPKAQRIREFKLFLTKGGKVRAYLEIGYPRDGSSWSYWGGEELYAHLTQEAAQTFLYQLETQKNENPAESVGRIYQALCENIAGKSLEGWNDWSTFQQNRRKEQTREEHYKIFKGALDNGVGYDSLPEVDAKTKTAFGNVEETPYFLPEACASILAELAHNRINSSGMRALLEGLQKALACQEAQEAFEAFLKSGTKIDWQSSQTFAPEHLYNPKLLRKAVAAAKAKGLNILIRIPNLEAGTGLALVPFGTVRVYPKRGRISIEGRSLPISEIREILAV